MLLQKKQNKKKQAKIQREIDFFFGKQTIEEKPFNKYSNQSVTGGQSYIRVQCGFEK